MTPDGWRSTKLGSIAEFRSGGTPSKENPAFWGGDFPWVSAKDMKTHIVGHTELGLSESGRKEANIAPKDAVLVLVRGMTLLKDIPVALTSRPVAFNQDIKALVVSDGVDPCFLSYLLVARKQQIRALVNTTNHGTGRLDTELLKGLTVDLPPLSEQRRIAEIISTWDRAIETVEKLIACTQEEKTALMQQLLTGKRRAKLAENMVA